MNDKHDLDVRYFIQITKQQVQTVQVLMKIASRMKKRLKFNIINSGSPKSRITVRRHRFYW